MAPKYVFEILLFEQHRSPFQQPRKKSEEADPEISDCLMTPTDLGVLLPKGFGVSFAESTQSDVLIHSLHPVSIRA